MARLRGSTAVALAFLLRAVLSQPAGATSDPTALLNCLCFCGCSALGWGCGVSVDCYYEPNPVNASPACNNPALGQCVCRGFGCGRAQYSPEGDPCNDECFRLHSGPSPTPTQQGPPTPTRTPIGPPTATPTPHLSRAIACDESRAGALEDGDQQPFGDGTWGDPFVFDLEATTSVSVQLVPFGFPGKIWLGDASQFGNVELITYGSSPQGATLPAGTYVIIITTDDPLPQGFWTYDVTLSCTQQFTPSPTRTRTATRTQSRTPSRTATMQPTPTRSRTRTPTSTPTRSRTRTPTSTPTRSATASRSPTASRTSTRTLSPTRTFTMNPSPTATLGSPSTPSRTASRTATRGTLTRTSAPTATATPEVCPLRGSGNAAGPPGCPVDLIADDIEVVQTIQDLNNGVDLVAYKRTFVRFHVHSTGRMAEASATLLAELGGPGGPPEELRAPPKIIQAKPQRGLLTDSFLFELRGPYLSGRVFLTATINPENVPTESDRGNNTIYDAVTFKEPLPFDLVLYSVSGPGNVNAPASYHLERIEAGVETLYPIPEANVWKRSLVMEGPVSFAESNVRLETMRLLDLARRGINTPGSRARYYAVWHDQDQTMPNVVLDGRAAAIPSFVASGAGRVTTLREALWDPDGSAADAIAVHELGHTLGRYHAEFCGARAGRPFPNELGFISKAREGPDAIWGFDAGRKQLHPPYSRDLMTYCPRQWVSDFTYDALLEAFLPGGGAAQGAITESRLLVVGTIDGRNGTVALEPLFNMPTLVQEEIEDLTGYAVIQSDASGSQLASHAFMPRRMHSLVAGGGSIDEVEEPLLFSETVRYAAGTQSVAIVGPGVLHVVSAGLAFPQVTLVQPNARATLDGDNVTVAWEGSDADGDPLTYRVQYSPDGGSSWITVAAAVTDTQTEIDRTQILASTNALFRVWVSDGIHTAFDESDSPSIVPNLPPTAQIVEPTAPVTVVLGQTVTFAGSAYDVDQGPLQPEQMRWFSNIDGLIGNGRMTGRADLGLGTHTITFEAEDRSGSIVSDSTTVRVVATAAELPPVPNQLLVAPVQIALDTRIGAVSETLTIDNAATRMLPWQVTVSDTWLALDIDEGQTRSEVRVDLVTAGLTAGIYEGTITFSSAGGGTPVEVFVEATIAACPGDCNGDGSVTIDELVMGVNLILTGTGLDACRALDFDAGGSVTIDELIRAIDSALSGCT